MYEERRYFTIRKNIDFLLLRYMYASLFTLLALHYNVLIMLIENTSGITEDKEDIEENTEDIEEEYYNQFIYY